MEQFSTSLRRSACCERDRIAMMSVCSDTRNHHASDEHVQRDMKKEPDPADATLTETMAARIEINELGDPARQKEITDAVEALDGVIETKIAKGALHVSYDPLVTTEKRIEQAVRSTGTTIKAAATDTESAHPDLPTPANVRRAPAKKPHDREQS
jgi:copper chaperone CopZ